MKVKTIELKSITEMKGVVIPSEHFGNVKIIDVEEHETWGTTVIIYLDRYHSDNAIARFNNRGGLVGGSMLVVKTDEPVTEFEK